MPDTGSPYFLPYPDLSDEADAPSELQALAAAEHNALATLRPRSSRYKTISMTLPLSNTFYVIDFDTAEANQTDTVPIPYSAGLWTIQEPGVYLIAAGAHFQFTGTNIACRLCLNVTGVAGPNRATLATKTANPNTSTWFSKLWRCEAGDTIQIEAYITVANATVYGSPTRYTYAGVSYVQR